ncbi:probable small ubiquitin-related modifier 1 [Coccomyxa sp. Obi]|nr:probable small ubiquitin-related modifier 1 [Coccomyxa sp. Obi]
MDQSAETKPKVEGGNVINLVVKDQAGTEVHFKVKSHTKFQKIMDAYAGKRSVDVSAIRFLYDGARLDGSSTPGDQGMEDNDVIDCVLEQIGGH